MNKLEIKIINEIKEKVKKAQYKALQSVNIELINLYWGVGKSLSIVKEKKSQLNLITILANEMQKDFPGIKGFSVSNIKYMVRFYNGYHGIERLESKITEISWSKHIIILQKCKEDIEKEFYILATKRFGWSKNVLIHQIEQQAYEKFLLNQTNYEKTLSKKVKNQGHVAIKDEYIFDFLNLNEEYDEKEFENEIIKNMRKFLMEMGNQFAFISNQYKIVVGGENFFIDILLYHRQLKCLVAIELKIGKFIPEYKGKMEFYLAVLNDTEKLPDENDAIGIIICKEKNRTVVEYSLKTSNMPIGVASYETTNELPKDYEELLPDKDEIIKNVDLFFSAGNKFNFVKE